MSLPAVSRRLKVLERVGLIKRDRNVQLHPCRIALEPLKEAADLLEQNRQQWEQRFDRIDA